VRVYDAGGKLVRTVAEGAFSPGRHAVDWDGRNDGGWRVPAGVYCYRIEHLTGAVAAGGRCILLR
jgi:flagellar basal-body rod modification protein FlgD